MCTFTAIYLDKDKLLTNTEKRKETHTDTHIWAQLCGMRPLWSAQKHPPSISTAVRSLRDVFNGKKHTHTLALYLWSSHRYTCTNLNMQNTKKSSMTTEKTHTSITASFPAVTTRHTCGTMGRNDCGFYGTNETEYKGTWERSSRKKKQWRSLVCSTEGGILRTWSSTQT